LEEAADFSQYMARRRMGSLDSKIYYLLRYERQYPANTLIVRAGDWPHALFNVFVFFNEIAGHGRLQVLSQFYWKSGNEMILVKEERCEPVDRLILQI